MILLLTILILPILLVYFLRARSGDKKSPPGPPGLPFIGNLHQFGSAATLHVYLWQLSIKYGPLMQMKLGSVPVLIVSSAKLAKAVMKTQDLSFCSRPHHTGCHKMSYNSMEVGFSPYGDHWREMKKIMTVHVLSGKKLQFRAIREDEVSKMVRRISGFAKSSQAVNLSEMVMCLMSNFVCRITFGKGYDEEGAEMERFLVLLEEAQAMMVAFFVSDYFPSIGWVDKLAGMMNRLEIAFEKLDSFYEELIDEHLDPKRKRNGPLEDDILDILIQLREERYCSNYLDWNSIKGMLTNIFIAGTDTSAVAIIWTMTALIKAPHIMKKLQSHIRETVGPKGLVDEDDLPNLPYLKAVINESLRLYPPGPLLVPRETTENCILEGYEIQAKTVVYVNVWAIARDPLNWDNPHEFLPERFLDSQIDVRGQDFGVTPFGSGRRMCPGMAVGLTNVELIVANLVYCFDWKLPMGILAEDIDVDCVPGLVMHKKNALSLLPEVHVF